MGIGAGWNNEEDFTLTKREKNTVLLGGRGFVRLGWLKEAAMETPTMLLNKSLSIKKLGILSLLCFSGVSIGQTLLCPEEITIHASLKQQYPGWQQFNELSPHYFNNLSLTSESPEQNATLVPDVTTVTKNVWDLTVGEEYWVVCHYLSSSVGLTQKIPTSSKQCWQKVKMVSTKATQPDNKLICE